MTFLKRIKILLLIVLCAFLIFSTGCDGFITGELYFLEITPLKETMFVGDTQRIECKYSNREKEKPDCIYYSANDMVATVSDMGTITARAPGVATIYIQDKISGEKLNVVVTVNYYYYQTVESDVHYYDEKIENCWYDFWENNGYIHRFSNWDVIKVADMLLTTSKGDYIFSDVYSFVNLNNKNLAIISDWGNNDVNLQDIYFTSDDLKSIANTYGPDIGYSDFEFEKAANYLNASYEKELEKYGNKIYLLDADDNYEYRIRFVADFEFVKCVHYYAQGTFNSILEILDWSVDSVVDVYTRTETVGVLAECIDARIIIEKREKSPILD